MTDFGLGILILAVFGFVFWYVSRKLRRDKVDRSDGIHVDLTADKPSPPER